MNLLTQLENQHVLIIGDVMLDRYLTGTVSRISPEAPVPVVLHRETEDRLGGAANVALNVQALGSTAYLCSVVGQDEDGDKFLATLAKHALPQTGILKMEGRRTTVKTRILANQQQMLRIDREDTFEIDRETAVKLREKVHDILTEIPVNAIIFQDYNKGVLTEWLIGQLLEDAQHAGIFTAVDPKKANFFAYKGVNLFKPNLKEVQESVPFPISTEEASLQKAADFLHEKLGNQFTMLTLSEKGLFLDGGSGGKRYPTKARNIADVSGAGDTVISIAAMALAAGLEEASVALLSNAAGGQVCEFAGVVPVNPDLLKIELAEPNR